MKIVEKKCPNCGANLDFNVGKRDVVCGHCRRKYAVQYDGMDFASLAADRIKSLKNINIDLRPARNIILIIAISFMVFAVLGMSIFLIVGINLSKINKERAKDSWTQYEIESQQRSEDFQREYEETREKINQLHE
jgi:hydrogenase maturation factor